MRAAAECPRCRAADPVRILYGLPAPDTFRDAQLGRISLGGCVIYPDRPDWRCRSCGHSWFYADERAALDKLFAEAKERSRRRPITPPLVVSPDGLRERTWEVHMGQKARVASEAFNAALRDHAISLLRGTAFEAQVAELMLEITASIRHPRTYMLRVRRAGDAEGWDEKADSIAMEALEELAGSIVQIEHVSRDDWPGWPLRER